MKYEDIPWGMGNCVGTDPEVWFEGDSHNNYGIQDRICRWCEIKTQCLAWALENEEEGFWGGQYFTGRSNWQEDNRVGIGSVYAGDNGAGMFEVWGETDGEVSSVIGDAEGLSTHTAPCRAEASCNCKGPVRAPGDTVCG